MSCGPGGCRGERSCGGRPAMSVIIDAASLWSWRRADSTAFGTALSPCPKGSAAAHCGPPFPAGRPLCAWVHANMIRDSMTVKRARAVTTERLGAQGASSSCALGPARRLPGARLLQLRRSADPQRTSTVPSLPAKGSVPLVPRILAARSRGGRSFEATPRRECTTRRPRFKSGPRSRCSFALRSRTPWPGRTQRRSLPTVGRMRG
jgi:hypothetical protein